MLNQEEKEFDLIEALIYKGFFPEKHKAFEDFNDIFIDLDSLLSILLREKIEDFDKKRKMEIVEILLSTVARFLEEYIDTSDIRMYYNMKEYKYFKNIYNGWCKEREKRFNNIETIEFVHKFLINKLKKLQERSRSFRLIQCEDSPILDIFKDINNLKNNKILIISRDPHYQCVMAYNDISIYDGKCLIDRENYYLEKNYPIVHYSLFPAYYLIAGMKRNEYNGVSKYGKKKTEILINENKIKIIKFDLPILESVKEYKKLFYLR